MPKALIVLGMDSRGEDLSREDGGTYVIVTYSLIRKKRSRSQRLSIVKVALGHGEATLASEAPPSSGWLAGILRSNKQASKQASSDEVDGESCRQ